MDIAQQYSQALEILVTKAYQNAPQQVKQILNSVKEEDGSFNWEKLDFQKLGFNVKTTQVNFCQKKIQIGNKYYVCDTCSNYSSNMIYLFCSQCYDNEKHVNHSVAVNQVLSQSFQGTCDCGIVERVDKSSFCNQHSSFSVQLECQINGEESQRFQKCFGSLFQIGMIQEDPGIFFQQIGKYFVKLNQNSIYYNRLTFRLINESCSQRFQEDKYLQFLQRVLQNSFLAMWICGDLKTRKELTKLVCRFIDQDQSQEIKYSPFQADSILTMINLTTIEVLINQGFYHEIFDGILKKIQTCFLKKKYDFNSIYQKIIAFQLNKIGKFDSKLIKKLKKLVKSMDYSQLMHLMKKIVSVFPESESINKYMRGQESQQENPWAKFQLIQNKGQQNLSNLPLDAQQLLTLFVDISSSLIALKGLDKKNFKNTLLQQGVPEQKLEHIMYWVAACSKGLFYRMNNQTNETQKQIRLIGILIIILSSTKQQQLVQKVHSSLFCAGEQQQGIQKIGSMVQKFYFVLSILLLSDIWIMIKKKKMSRHQDSKNNENSEHLYQFLKNWLRSFLYSKKVVSQQELIDLKMKGILDFKGIGSILDQLCTFNSSDGVFNYSSAKVYKNIANEFPLISNRYDFQSINSTQITYADKIPMQQGSIAQSLIELLLSKNNLLQLFREQWKKYLQKQQKDTNYKYAYLYMFFLVVFNSLTKGQNEEVKEEIQIYRKNENLLNEFTQNEEEIKAIKKLLGMDQIVIKPEQTVQKPNQLKAKGQQKKKKLAQKFEKKRLLFLDRIPSFKSQSANQEQQICILCHEKKKIDNEIVYIGAINKKTMCDALFGNDNKTNTLMNTCFHALHINCYINIEKQKQDQSFNCPLCQAYCNFIIPIKYDASAKRLNKIVQNVKIVLMISVFKNYDPEDFFMVIFKHLVESKGLNSLIYEPLYSQKLKINTKRDDFLQQLMMDKYLSAEKEERQEYLKWISSFIQSLSSCTNQWVKNVQLLFAESLLTIITLRQSNSQVKLLQHIKSNIKSEEYAIVLQQFLHIMEEQFELPFDQAQSINQNPISLSLPSIKLPLTVPECIEKYCKAMCEKCSGKFMSMLCLFCGKTFCYECKDDHEQEKHHKHKFYFNIDDMSIYSRNQRQNTIDCVYLNQFKVSYSERGNYEEGTFFDDQFELNEKFLVKKICNFFAN